MWCEHNCPKNWTGSNPKCGFDGNGELKVDEYGKLDNWNCGIINKIRDLCYEGQPQKLPMGIDYQYCDDQKYASFNVSYVEDDDFSSLCLWVTWYKSRGGTDGMWLLDESSAKRPNKEQLLKIIEHYSR